MSGFAFHLASDATDRVSMVPILGSGGPREHRGIPDPGDAVQVWQHHASSAV